MAKQKYTRLQTSLHPEIIDLLNQQVSKEAEASSIYLAMASWCEVNGFPRSAEFFYCHAVEERDHMMKIFRFLNENGARAFAPEVGKVQQDFKSLREVYEKTLEHEIEVTKSIFSIFQKARQEADYASENFLQWFVEEQLEEERLVHSILDMFQFMEGKDNPLALKLIDERIPLEDA
ncbi:ferritin [Capnocytophaga cynodegmi]|uniref:Ferritin n=1 Tax=Capnocytophaga cynodegmi TaxID=28189 RepID=A0A0B7HD66_9FLAO|nr:ferritin [Capnocytophaga cynodegmi]ATA67398.1 ferritin [Capnocytophaga cynodegmi]CEN35528.1 putative ferritin-2 [Capnocytophaga cynodegmi]CEN39449.1 putative ferritin-2 [Capnocytophaga cynodegmi]GIM51762.1 ferritin [Capnocytophaga cynodegmi]GIM54174.1 ferritin [Capnocytophaga cynodegmi]